MDHFIIRHVLPEYQKQGIARGLMSKFVDEARARTNTGLLNQRARNDRRR